jgi:hypothetical protein
MRKQIHFLVIAILIIAASCDRPVNQQNQQTDGISNDPKTVVKNFIENLGQKDFQSAFDKTQVEKWGSFENFSSKKAFGGINATSINVIKQEPDENNNAIVFVDAYYYDPTNGDNRFKEKFYLKQFGGEWKIVDLKIIGTDKKNNEENNSSLSSNLDFMKKFKDKYPNEVNLLDNSIVKERLKKIIGVRYNFVKQIWEVETPIKVENGFFFAEAMQAHSGGDPSAAIMVDFSKNVIYVGIRENAAVKFYSEDDSDIPQQLSNWANEN